MFGSWVADAFASLPGCKDDIFRKFWDGKRLLKFNDRVLDAIDKYSARLVCAILSRRERLFLVLPDLQPHRPALLFATALIRYCRDSRLQILDKNTPKTMRVLYFGTTVGIREQLGQVAVGDRGKNLADLFQQQHTGKRSAPRKVQQNVRKYRKYNLPEVVTIYSPIDPVAVIEQYQPQWIAIDCGDEANLSWLLPLLQDAVHRNIPVIAWGQNPLSECVAQFSKYGQVWPWPSPLSSSIPSLSKLRQNPQSILQPSINTTLQPLVLEGTAIDTLESSFRDANRQLARSAQLSRGRLAADTLKLHYKYLRSLESLSVPFDFYEAEATRYWGMKSFGQLGNECDHFRDACYHNYPDIACALEEVSARLEATVEKIKTSGSPLWSALCHLSIEEPPTGEARLITFISRARKELFLLALLARYNRTEEDLRHLRTWVFSLDELRQLMRPHNLCQGVDESFSPLTADKTLRWHPLLVGLPSPLVTPKLLPILLQKTASVLIYPHQSSALANNAQKWAKSLHPDFCRVTEVLSSLSGLPRPQELPLTPSRLEIADLIGIDAGSGTTTKYPGVKPLWQPEDPVSEVARLLQSDQELAEAEPPIAGQSRAGAATATGEGQESCCERAIEVNFEQGWHACFAPDDTLNVIVTGSTGQQTDERYVRSLRPGDRVVAIPGQRRQSLYDLIVSRVHGHPAIELHLALIRRWQQDFVAAYQRWRHYGVRNLDDLLGQMQQRGSTLTSTFTLRQWLWGNTLCPDDTEDLRRLAEVLDMGFVRAYYKKIAKAARRLRGLHRGLSRRLNSWLEQQVTGAVGRSDEDLIDPELGLTFSHFRTSLLILRVTAVRPVTGLFLRSSLGRFERDIQQ
jgi:hypothetical protein